jgi:hypothetical protein
MPGSKFHIVGAKLPSCDLFDTLDCLRSVAANYIGKVAPEWPVFVERKRVRILKTIPQRPEQTRSIFDRGSAISVKGSSITRLATHHSDFK